MSPRTTRAGLVFPLVLAGALAAQDRGAVPGSFTGARPAGVPGGAFGGSSNIGGSPASGGGIVGGPGMPGGLGGFRGTEKSWHCPRCQREVARGAAPPASAACCGQTLVPGEGLHAGADAPPPEAIPSDPAAPATAPLANTPAPAAPGGEPESEGNGQLIGLGIGILLLGLLTLGLVVFLALRMRGANRRPGRRRRVRN